MNFWQILLLIGAGLLCVAIPILSAHNSRRRYYITPMKKEAVQKVTLLDLDRLFLTDSPDPETAHEVYEVTRHQYKELRRNKDRLSFIFWKRKGFGYLVKDKET
ncbi:MAG: hypothetical protein WCO30_01925 [bacterium]